MRIVLNCAECGQDLDIVDANISVIGELEIRVDMCSSCKEAIDISAYDAGEEAGQERGYEKGYEDGYEKGKEDEQQQS